MSTLRSFALTVLAAASFGCGGAPSQAAGAGPNAPAPEPAAACRACGEGSPSEALLASLRARSTDAKECFRRELQTSEAAGNMSVRVAIGSDGSVCSAAAEGNTTGSEALRSCVVDLLEKAFYPPPEEGCVVVTIPFSFAITEGKTEDCGRLVQWINQRVDAIGGGPPKEGAEALDALAASMDATAEEAGRVHLTTEELRAYALSYAELARDIAQAARQLATADRSQDDAKKQAAQAALQAAVKREDPIVDAINRACTSP